MAVLEPRLAILDEIDSGLDIDALRVVAEGVNALRRPDRAILLVTHYQRLLEYIVPDHVHVMAGGPHRPFRRAELAHELEQTGLRLGRRTRGRRGRAPEVRATVNAAETSLRRRLRARRRASPPWLADARRAALARFQALGLPTARHEDWRFTSLAAHRRHPLRARPGGRRPTARRRCSRRGAAAGSAAARLRQRPARPGALDARRPAARRDPREPRRGAPRATGPGPSPTSAGSPRRTTTPSPPLNAALFEDGGFVFLPRGAAVELPLHAPLPHRRRDKAPGAAAPAHPRRRRGGQPRRRRGDVLGAAGRSLTNAVTELVAGATARSVDHCGSSARAPRPSTSVRLHVGAAAAERLRAHAFSLGGASSRNELDSRLAGEGARVRARTGSTWRPATQHADHHTWVDHAVPRCTSRERYKGVLDGTRAACSTAASACSRTPRRPTRSSRTRNLLLSDDAMADTKPQLEIFADDVKCSTARRSASSTRTRSSTCARAAAGGGAEPAHLRLRERDRGARRGAGAPRRVRRLVAARLPAGAAPGGGMSATCERERTWPSGDRPAERSGASTRPAARRLPHPHGSRCTGKPLVYLDNAATTQKPRRCIDAMSRYYEETNANVHRGVHLPLRGRHAGLRGRARDGRALHQRRRPAGDHLHARHDRGASTSSPRATAARLAARATRCSSPRIEHHSNIVPWQMLCDAEGRDARGRARSTTAATSTSTRSSGCSRRARALAVTHVSNALGTVNPLDESSRRATRRGVPVLVDGAQAVPHLPVDVAATSAATSTRSAATSSTARRASASSRAGARSRGDAAVPGRRRHDPLGHLREDRLQRAARTSSRRARPTSPARSGSARRSSTSSGSASRRSPRTSTSCSRTRTSRRSPRSPALRIVGTAREKSGVISFLLGGVHPHDVGTILDREGIAVRTGHHCAQPVMDRFGVPATARASLALYNTREDVDALVARRSTQAREVFG